MYEGRINMNRLKYHPSTVLHAEIWALEINFFSRALFMTVHSEIYKDIKWDNYFTTRINDLLYMLLNIKSNYFPEHHLNF